MVPQKNQSANGGLFDVFKIHWQKYTKKQVTFFLHLIRRKSLSYLLDFHESNFLSQLLLTFSDFFAIFLLFPRPFFEFLLYSFLPVFWLS